MAFASGATDVLASAKQFDSLADALADTVLAVAVSAEPREFGPLPAEPEAAAAAAFEVLAQASAHRVAFVFGAERTGLSIESVQACGLLTSIPASPVYSSLNLAQAIQIVAFCLRQVALRQESAVIAGVPSELESSRSLRQPVHLLADQRAIEGLMAHLERALTAIGFLDPLHPKKLMPRLRRLVLRARLGTEEVDLLRGICKLMERRNRPG
jgi:tRNA/rRNA methyltransferase